MSAAPDKDMAATALAIVDTPAGPLLERVKETCGAPWRARRRANIDALKSVNVIEGGQGEAPASERYGQRRRWEPGLQ